ncbi:C-C motif chemokine 15-like [Sciurus carolinensis]|uniref:C-C motif chemokine 15-like n=1 Tax=Sciurus carolinensis TaxID=30640 RepID=UPI001FB26398|nr:C-C motif chemokine 15-like [Sciurus carolinensis]
MKVSTAALSFLILAAALGSQARVIHDLEKSELLRESFPTQSPEVFHSPADCCFSYTPRRIRCTFMKGYFETSSECSQPGVIFLNKKGQYICANPKDEKVLECMANLSFNSLPMDLGQ